MIGIRAFVGLLVLTVAAGGIPAAVAANSLDGKWVPELTGWVNDTASVLSKADRGRLSDTLRDYQQETHHQIALLTIATLDGETIEIFSLRTARAWGLGAKGIDDGILVTLAMKEKMVRIELGKGMQKFISDADAKVIIATEMNPEFANGNFPQGLERGLKRLMDAGRRFVAKSPAASPLATLASSHIARPHC